MSFHCKQWDGSYDYRLAYRQSNHKNRPVGLFLLFTQDGNYYEIILLGVIAEITLYIYYWSTFVPASGG